MRFLRGMNHRVRVPEVMDQPGLDAGRHRAALSGLARINRWSRSAGILWPPMAKMATVSSSRPIRVLDLASGGGDVTIALWRKAQNAGLPLHFDGCDVSPTAIAVATQRAREAAAAVRFFQTDLFNDAWPDGYDAIICSLFLHHLSDDEAVELLRRASGAAARSVLINDLVRSTAGLLLAHVACRVLTRSDIVRIDGPRSVRAAFTRGEAAELAGRAGLDGATVTPRWPCRFLLQWNRP